LVIVSCGRRPGIAAICSLLEDRLPYCTRFYSNTLAIISLGDHDVKAKLVMLFLYFDQAVGVEHEQLKFHPAHHARGHVAARQINRQPGHMGRGCLAFRGRGVPVAAAQFLLHFQGSDRRVNHQGLMELGIESPAQISQKLRRPRAHVAPSNIQALIHRQRVAHRDGDEFAALYCRRDVVIILVPLQLVGVDLLVLENEREMGRPEQWVPLAVMFADAGRT
jgi:hypothetical protein